MNRPAAKPRLLDLDDFEDLLADQPEDERWELIGGRVVRMMVGARWEHNRIVNNVSAGLNARFRANNSPCRTLTETFRLKEAKLRSSLLPDIIVYCTPLPEGATWLDDPAIVMEVLSKGTERRDREDKWAIYREFPSLKHYVLIKRDEASVEVIDRRDGSWSGFRSAEGLDAILDLPLVGVSLPLSDIYEDVLSC